MKIKSSKSKKFSTPEAAFLAARKLFKNQKEFANKCGVCQQTISKWERHGVPIKQAIVLEKVLNGFVTRFDLRPDFFAM